MNDHSQSPDRARSQGRRRVPPELRRFLTAERLPWTAGVIISLGYNGVLSPTTLMVAIVWLFVDGRSTRRELLARIEALEHARLTATTNRGDGSPSMPV